MISARFAFVNVQVTVSPGSNVIAYGLLPSSHVADRRSQPVGELSVTAYEPGRIAPLSWGVAASVRLNPWLRNGLPPARLKSNDTLDPEGWVTLSTTMWPRFVFVNVQVTISPGPIPTDVGALPSSHVAPVRSQPVTALSTVVYVPAWENTPVGTRSPNVMLPDPELVVIENEPRSPVKKNSPSPPVVSFSMMIVPRAVFVNVHVTVSPGFRPMALGALPSSHVVLVRSHPVLAASATEYVPGTRKSLVWDCPFERKKFASQLGSNSKLESPPTVTFSTVILLRAVFVNVHVTVSPASRWIVRSEDH